MKNTYLVQVTRKNGQWRADVVDKAYTFGPAGNLIQLEKLIREAIVKAEELPSDSEQSFDLEWDMTQLGSLAVEASRLASNRRRLDHERQTITARTIEIVGELTAQGWSVRDTAGLLGLTPGRISQITTRNHPKDEQESMNPRSKPTQDQ